MYMLRARVANGFDYFDLETDANRSQVNVAERAQRSLNAM